MARETRTNTLTASALGEFLPPASRRAPAMRDSLVGSARVDTLATREAQATGAQSSKNFSKTWHRQMWTYFDSVGELSYTLGFVGNCLARCTLTIGAKDERGVVGPAFDEDGNALADGAEDALDIIQAIKATTGGQSQLMWSFGPNLGGAGEALLVGTPPKGMTPADATIDQCEWEILSTDEFEPVGEDYLRRKAPGAKPEEIPGDSVHVVRIWRSHPRYSELPYSSIRGVLDILEELYLLTREVAADAKSRLSNGNILCVPDEIEFVGDAADDGEGDDGDPFTRDLIFNMSQPIQDRGSAAALVPFVLRAPAEHLHPDRLRTIDLSRKHSGDSVEKRKEAVQRFAQGVDLPVEVVTGHANTTFANAVVIDDSIFKVHIEPLLELIVDAFTVGILQPALKAMGINNAALCVHYDSTELVSRPNKSENAKELHDRWAISDASLRATSGFTDNDAPSDEEVERRIAIKQRINVKETVATTPQSLVSEDAAIPGLGGQPASPAPQETNTDAVLSASVSAMAELAVNQAIIRAGGRLRNEANKRQPALREQLAQVPSADVPVTLGPTLVDQLSRGDDLFHAQFDPLWALVTRMTGDQNYADAVRRACLEIANERMYQPRRQFPLDRLPRYSERGIVSAAA